MARTAVLPTAFLCATGLLSPGLAQAQPIAPQLGITSATTTAAAAPRTIGLNDALTLAVHGHPNLAARRADLKASDAEGKAAGARMLPAITLTQMFNWVDESIKLKPAPQATSSAAAMLSMIPNKLAVNALIIGARQPLLDLLPLAYDFRAARAEAAAGCERLAYEQAVLETDVRTRFASLFRARALIETSRQSEIALADQVQRAKAQLKAGSLTQTDVLRLDAALAQASQQRVTAEANETVERAYLLELLGLAEEGDAIDFVLPQRFVDDEAIAPQALLRHTALSKRADLSAQAQSAESLRLGAKARGFALLPSIEISASYANLWGEKTPSGGSHVAGNIFAAGVMANWQVWGWGQQWETYRAARARAQAARSRLEAQRRAIGAEVASRHASVVASDSAVVLAQAQVASAEEAFRVMLATLAAEAATTTDLLDAEASQTRARNALVDARFSAIIARLELARALGGGITVSR